MKVFALISGGKDSIFNIKKCIDNGNQIIALGNLYNFDQITNQQGKELDSYMYQTVGTNITVGIAQCLNKPLYRQKITGKPKKTSLQYQGTMHENEGDQVQDLHCLIETVLAKHPEIQAISSGAIFSSYQSNRILELCNRFKLKSLTYLWQLQQPPLLKQMINYYSNKAIVIKVASFGLKPEHLNKGLEQLEETFLKLYEICGMNVCGEGGQYESLVLDCPLYLNKRIVIDEQEVISQGNGDSIVAYLKIKKYHLEAK